MKRITKEEIIGSIKRVNPWWDSAVGNQFSLLPKRVHFNKLLEYTLQKKPVRALVLVGTRRVGKTVLLYQIIDELIKRGKPPKEILYVSLDNPVFRLNSLEDFFNWGADWSGSNKKNMTVFFDEIQYLEHWEQQLKVLVDTYPETKFVVTGSAAAALNKSSKESGAGRFTNYLLPPLSFYEYIYIKGEIEKTPNKSIDLLKLNELYFQYLNFGGFPETIASKELQEKPEQYIGQDILDKVLGRDLPSIFGVNNPNELHKLFAALAYNTSNEISLESISKTAGVQKIDINKYISFLESAFLIWVIEKTDNKIKNFKRRTFFKVMLTNPSLRSAIFGKIDGDSPALEGLAETAIYSQLKVYEGALPAYKYAKWSKGGSKGEVDLVRIDKSDQAIAAVEVKWSDGFLKNKTPKSLISFCENNSIDRPIITSKSIFETKDYRNITVHCYPTSYLCFVLGMHSGIRDTIVKHFRNLPDRKNFRPEETSKSLVESLTNDLVAIKYLNQDLQNKLPNIFEHTNSLFK